MLVNQNSLDLMKALIMLCMPQYQTCALRAAECSCITMCTDCKKYCIDILKITFISSSPGAPCSLIEILDSSFYKYVTRIAKIVLLFFAYLNLGSLPMPCTYTLWNHKYISPKCCGNVKISHTSTYSIYTING